MGLWLKCLAFAVAAAGVGLLGHTIRSSRENERAERFAAEAAECLADVEESLAKKTGAPASFYECFRTGRLDTATVNRALAKHGLPPLKHSS